MLLLPKPFEFLLLACIATFLSGCMSLTGYHTGRSLGKNNNLIILSGNIYGTPYQQKEANLFGSPPVSNGDEFLTWFNGEIQYHRGLSRRFDLGVRANTELMLGLMSKYQVIGTESSEWAVAVGAEIGVLFPNQPYIQLPFFFSYHLNHYTCFYCSPRFVKSWFYRGDSTTGFNYFGGNLGFQVGRTNVFAAEIGFYRSVRFDKERYFPDKLQEHVLPIVGLRLLFPF